MKNKFFRTALAVVLGLGISLAAAPGVLAVQGDVVVSSEIYVYLSDPGETLAIASATVSQIAVTASTVSITMASGDTAVTISSPSRYRLTVTSGITDPGTTCGSGSSTLVIPAQSSTVIVVVDPSTTCPSGGGGGGTVSPSPSASPSPSVSPSPSPSPSVSPEPSTSPEPSPLPSPEPLNLVAIPVLPANPTTAEIQVVITAIQHNIAVLLAELTKLQQTDSTLFGNDLYYGLKGNSEVVRLQKFLIGKGYLSSGYATGHYLSLTVQAVKAYQLANGITPVNGRCGPKTRASINADLGL